MPEENTLLEYRNVKSKEWLAYFWMRFKVIYFSVVFCYCTMQTICSTFEGPKTSIHS